MGVGLVWFRAMAHLNSNDDGVPFYRGVYGCSTCITSPWARQSIDVSLFSWLWLAERISESSSTPPADDCR